MATISHVVCVASFLVLHLFLFSILFFKFPYSANTTCSMSFNPVLFAELLRKHEWNVQSKTDRHKRLAQSEALAKGTSTVNLQMLRLPRQSGHPQIA